MDRDVIAEWFRLYANDVYNFLVYYTGSRDVEDLVQETFSKACTRHTNHIKEPKAWLFSIARNKAIDAMRKTRTKNRHQVIEYDFPATIEEQSRVEHIVETNERNQQLISHIMNLKQNHREVVLLRAVEGWSIKEAATILGWTEAKVKTTYHRAMNDLKLRVQGGGYINGVVD